MNVISGLSLFAVMWILGSLWAFKEFATYFNYKYLFQTLLPPIFAFCLSGLNGCHGDSHICLSFSSFGYLKSPEISV